MFSPRGGEYGPDGKKFDPTTGQWMREAMESRVAIEELKAQNDKLQHDVYGLNSKMNLMYECCADMGVVDRLGSLMQRKLREFQATQVARNVPTPANVSVAPVHPMGSPPRAARKNDLGTSDEGFICGSSNFQDVAAYSSSYRGQVSRGNFHRVRVFEAEEAKLRDQLDIFGVPKLPLQKAASNSPTTRTGDTIDNLLMSAEATNSPMKSGRQDSQRLFGSGPPSYDGYVVGSSRAQGRSAASTAN
ncbi:hypothetical protein PHYPSEUDO_014184 [Phytophthora pseudosyringae]|uniref:Uncharacterized protein n=1 Tax=Phytophthora pseudosyringae TaxID=221518 RepID=A0A8T1W263_9STRA|nr:hypothetical protein PHYPSEUDO_014184 [Phytophthora pseudosyringae]